MSSRGQLEYAGRGMNFDCVESREYELGSGIFRIEVYGTPGNFKAMAYHRIGSYWKAYWSQRTAWEKRDMLDKVEKAWRDKQI